MLKVSTWSCYHSGEAFAPVAGCTPPRDSSLQPPRQRILTRPDLSMRLSYFI